MLCTRSIKSLSSRSERVRHAVFSLETVKSIWTRPTPDRDADFVKPAYIPSQPVWQPSRREEGTPLYAPPPEFRPAELPDKPTEMPAGPKMPERRPDPIPAGNPKEKPSEGQPERREAPPATPKESAPPRK
ncbi:hypothetical protein CEUSTIGMA_g12264.t1 [Chlamydomonas eustigma]|uniref:Uncharacterized protein n=1 Tax=Chlamydomonas eustigma TaxID=1157962 RepID=A0A250XPB6_9CHLO|nr:hypothetical protein CEUSTIGMA_g12264.t1 [Chlamydomonas eustigma]|eukprot:GAX84843.1 hypothetical protein CEUSTIGMA_g12264.t1 [Chlamydomonas eustigma]